MTETVADLRELPRAAAYGEVREQMRLVLDGIDDPIAGMATLAALLHGSFGFLWAGFYRVAKSDKRICYRYTSCGFRLCTIKTGRYCRQCDPNSESKSECFSNPVEPGWCETRRI